ncbi:MAG: hypothetical protein M1822_002542 [Bathelium mastoideum]|nr:MAG: hypothetical protein M1822_002542 [Bathelium mastoideum]
MAEDGEQGQQPAGANDSTAHTDAAKPTVLIIGGLGYIGRFLALHIHQNALASSVRIVDKQLPELAMLAPEFAEACSKDKFVQADASRTDVLDKILKTPDGKTYDYIFNCGGETRYSQDDAVYRSRSYQLSLTLGETVARVGGCKAFVELSTGFVYAPDRTPRREHDRCKPWLKIAKWKLEAEEELGKLQQPGGKEHGQEGLPLVVLRTAHVYGPYAGRWLGTALALARVYQSLGKEMKFLWGKELRSASVHVEDVARAMWAAAGWRAALPREQAVAPFSADGDAPTAYPLFNIVDRGETAQGTLAGLIHDVFRIPTTFTSVFINTFARLNLEHVVDDVNDETLDPWSEMLAKSNCVANTPLTPFMEKELLQDKDVTLDGGRFERVLGFRYKHERLTKAELEDVIESYKRMNWWP